MPENNDYKRPALKKVVFLVLAMVLVGPSAIASPCTDACDGYFAAYTGGCTQEWAYALSECDFYYYECVYHLGFGNPQCDTDRTICGTAAASNYTNCYNQVVDSYVACLNACE